MRGYLRAYARIVGLDSADVVSAFDDLGLIEQSNHQSYAMKPQDSVDKYYAGYWVSALIIIGLVILSAFWLRAQQINHQVVTKAITHITPIQKAQSYFIAEKNKDGSSTEGNLNAAPLMKSMQTNRLNNAIQQNQTNQENADG